MIVRTCPAKILLVCSDPVMRQVLREVLDDKGYTVIPAGDLGAAVDRLLETRPDLLIIRPYLSSIAGHDAAMYLRTKAPGMPVLLVDGMIEDDRLLYRESLKSIDVFPKPFTTAEFLEKVQQVVDSLDQKPDQAG